MITRKIYNRLEAHLLKRQATVIVGLRRTGKSTAMKYLLGKVSHQNKLMLDFERIENRMLFNQSSNADIEKGLLALGLDLSKPAVLALDEIQLVQNAPSVIKSLYDQFDLKVIATGSSSFYLKNHFSESLAGRKQIFEMFPLDFEEFLWFRGIDTKDIGPFRLQSYVPEFYNRWSNLYEEFLKAGGFPEVALSGDEADRQDYLRDILNSYIELDVRLLSDFSVSDSLYKIIMLLGNRAGSRLDYSKISSILGINRHKVKDYLELLKATYFLYIVTPFTTGTDKELTKQPKVYFADHGLLQICSRQQGEAIFENAIACQLIQHGELNYYSRQGGAEVDFILNRSQSFEVKETPSPADLAVLEQRSKLAGIGQWSLIGRFPPQSGFSNFTWGGSVF